MQVEEKHNKLLDESSRYREDMGEISDNISLGTALETLWEPLAQPGAPPDERRLIEWHWANLEFANAQVGRIAWALRSVHGA
jgi:hypothetical protein